MKTILVAPFSNSDIRDWPVGHFADLAGLLLEDLAKEDRITVVGTKPQRLRANEIVRRYDPRRVVNACGWHTWPQLVEEIKTASCVVGNNSGVAHLSGFHGVPTVCVFGGSHQRLEWRPQGFSVSVISRSIGCSPCQRDHNQDSPYAKACLRHIEPRLVAATVFKTMERVARAKDLPSSAPSPAWSDGGAPPTAGGTRLMGPLAVRRTLSKSSAWNGWRVRSSACKPNRPPKRRGRGRRRSHLKLLRIGCPVSPRLSKPWLWRIQIRLQR